MTEKKKNKNVQKKQREFFSFDDNPDPPANQSIHHVYLNFEDELLLLLVFVSDTLILVLDPRF